MEKLRIIVDLLKSSEVQQKGWQSDLERLIDFLQYTNFDDLPEKVQGFLGGMLIELDLYVDNPEWRAESPAYYGEERLIENIDKALERLKELGVDV